MSKKKGLGKFIAGAAVGAGLGVLFAPKKGSETRKDLMKKLNELKKTIKEIDFNDVKDNIEEKIGEIKEELKDLDKEKVLKIAKKKGQDILKKADELCKLAIKKGTPVLEKATAEIKEKTIAVLEETINKLENSKEVKTNKSKKSQ